MADQLQKLSGLFTELQNEAIALDKRNTDLTQEITTKEARLTYLDESIADQAELYESNKLKQHTVIGNLEDEIALLKLGRGVVEKEAEQLQTKIQLLKSDVKTMQKSTDEEAERFNDIIEGKKEHITALDAELKDKNYEFVLVEEEIATSKQAAEVLDKQVALKSKEVSDEIAKLDADLLIVQQRHKDVVSALDDKQNELEDMESKVNDAVEVLTAAKTKHTEFLEYEKRATIALEARESALLSGEKVLSDARMRAQRSGILDNV